MAYTSWAALTVAALVYAGLSFTRIPLTYRNTGQNWRVVSEFLAQVAQPEETIVVHGNPRSAVALQFYMPEFNVIERDPQLSYDTIFEGQERAWLVFRPGTSIYTYPKYWTDRNKGIALIFRGGWYPDIERRTELAPAQSWDLFVVRASPNITSTKRALEMHHTWLTQAEARNPDDVRRHLTLAEAYQRFDRCDLAVTEYEQALHEGYVNDQLASYIYDARAICWHRLGSVERAIADWQRAIARADWSSTPYEHLGDAYNRLGRTEETEALYKDAIASNPNEAWPHVLLGDAYSSRGLGEAAVNEYQKAIELDPGNRTLYGQLVEMYVARGEDARVISLLQYAAKRNPLSGWPHYELGNYYQRLGWIVDAMAEYRKAVELNPGYAANPTFLRNTRWNLASTLNLVHAYSDEVDLLWWPGNTWVKPRPYAQEVLVGRSTRTVQGRAQPDQLSLRPFSDQQQTFVEFEIPDNPFVYLQTSFALADEVAEQSNGVGYTIEVKTKDDADWQALLHQEIAQNVWQEHTISLLPFWNEDLSFRLAIDARGDDAHDLVQSTIELIPALEVWDLSAHLEEAQFVADSMSLEWREDGFYRSDGQRLVGPSELPVNGENLPRQVMFYPFDSGTASTLLFSLEDSPHRVLKTSFGLADQALSQSNGVEYAVSISVDGGQSFTDLIHTTVTTNSWRSELVELPPSRDLVLKLRASARQDATFDWLQVNLVLLPINGK
jgi:tetratricopeptide (TPR) repeat protein